MSRIISACRGRACRSGTLGPLLRMVPAVALPVQRRPEAPRQSALHCPCRQQGHPGSRGVAHRWSIARAALAGFPLPETRWRHRDSGSGPAAGPRPGDRSHRWTPSRALQPALSRTGEAPDLSVWQTAIHRPPRWRAWSIPAWSNTRPAGLPKRKEPKLLRQYASSRFHSTLSRMDATPERHAPGQSCVKALSNSTFKVKSTGGRRRADMRGLRQ